MFQGSSVFETHYKDYCRQISEIDFASIANTLGIEQHSDQVVSDFSTGITGFPGTGSRMHQTIVLITAFALSLPNISYYAGTDPS